MRCEFGVGGGGGGGLYLGGFIHGGAYFSEFYGMSF